MYKSFLKRVIDFSASLVGLIIFSPLIIVVTIGLFFANQGKPFFFQTRPGKNAKLFRIIKFKKSTIKKMGMGLYCQMLPD
jgi:lipopolysaccharide/colanic/teichoic acid biosynthesis glycosyltransferase